MPRPAPIIDASRFIVTEILMRLEFEVVRCIEAFVDLSVLCCVVSRIGTAYADSGASYFEAFDMALV